MPTRSRTRYPHAFSPGRAAPGFVGEGSWDPRWGGLTYNAVAWFTRPVDGRMRASTTDRREGGVAAATPEAAARHWLARLTPAQRAAVDRIILWPPSRERAQGRPYQGPALVYALRDGVMTLVEARIGKGGGRLDTEHSPKPRVGVPVPARPS